MDSRHSLEQALARHLWRHPLTRPGERILVAVSGGADSLALLRLLHALRESLGLTLETLHFDHGLRPESAAEAEWVAERARRLGLVCHVRHHPGLAARRTGLQAAARAWRREEGQRLLAARGAQWIATGHQRDDHLETILLKLLRGVHLAHIRGMAPRAGRWIRPLLPFSHETLTGYLRDLGEGWLEDPSNRSPRYKRNCVRRELMPLLDTLADGGLARRLETLERQSGALADWLSTLPAPPQSDPAAAIHWIEAASLAELPALARADRLHAFIQERLPGAVEASLLERTVALLRTGRDAWELDLPGGRMLKRRGARLLLERRAAVPDSREHRVGPWRVRTPAHPALTLREGGCEGEEGLLIHNLPRKAALEVRTRRPGDRFHPPWRDHPVKVARFLRDQRIPLWEREGMPLVLADGRVVAIYPRWVARGHDRPLGYGATLCLAVAEEP